VIIQRSSTRPLARLRPLAILAAILLARVGIGYQFQTVGSLGPTLIPLFGMDYIGFGKLIGAYMLMGTFVALPLGLAGGRFGDRLMVTAGLALMVAGAVVSALADAPDGIATGRIVCGVGGVALVVIQGKVVADWFHGRGFLLAVSASAAAYSMGVGLGQLTQPPLAAAFGWPAAFLAGGAIQAAALVLFLTSFHAPPPRVATPSLAMPPGAMPKVAMPTVAPPCAVPSRMMPPLPTPPLPIPAPGARRARARHLPNQRECLLMAIAGLVWASYTSGYTGFLSYAPSLMAARGESMALTGVVVAIASWGSLPPTLFGAGLANRYGGFRIFLIGTGAVVIGIAGSALSDWPILWAIVLGVIGQIQPGVIQAVGTLSARVETRAAGMGIFYTIYYAAGTIVPALCGVAADWTGGPAGALLCAAAVSALAIPAFALHRRLVSHAAMLARA
jgi:MFS family permease